MENHQIYFDRLRKARYRLLERFPFYGKLLLSLPFKLNPYCESAFTDMKRIVFSPAFIDELNDTHLEIVILHELLHCVLFHCTRGKGKIQDIYNLACDIVVNSIIYQDYKINRLNQYAFIHTYNGKEGYLYSAEELYDLLIKEENIVYIPLDLHISWEILCKDETLEHEFNELVQKSYKSCGEINNGAIRKLLEDRYEPKLRWDEQLMEYLSNMKDKEDYNFSKRDVRIIDDSYVLPDLSEEDDMILNQIFVAIDATGSISNEEFSHFKQELDYQCELLQIRGFYGFFNTKMSEIKPFDEVTKIDFSNVKGYGGTSFHCIFKKAKELNSDHKLKAIIIFTDGYASFPKEIDIPVVWILNNNDVNPPYGKIIRMV